MKFLRQTILAIGMMGLAGSFAACGGADKDAAEPTQPAAEEPAEELGEPGAAEEAPMEDPCGGGEVEEQLAPTGDGTDPCGGW